MHMYSHSTHMRWFLSLNFLCIFCTFLINTKMSTNTSASLQHILISIEEYERLKNIEKQYQKLHEGIEEKLQIISK